MRCSVLVYTVTLSDVCGTDAEEEGKSMEKVKHQIKLFVFSVIETVLAIQINIISSVLSPFS